MDHVLRCHEIVKSDFVLGRNCRLVDSRGKEYVDLESGIWSTALGHAHPRIDRAMHAQIEKVIHLGTRYPSPLAEEAAVDVLEIVGLENGKCVFLSSGSEAVEFSAQAARRTTKRPLLVTLATSYLAAYGSAGTQAPGEWRIVDRGSTDADLDTIPFDEVGAFVFEPGASGMAYVRFPPVELVQEIARRTKETGGLVVANEVTAGMGRTGRWFGFQHYGLQPDIVALGKGLGNGYPVSAVALRRSVAEELEAGGLRYAQSHQNDPLGCAVVREVIATMRDERLVERAETIGASFLGGLKRLEGAHDVVREARGRGMLLGLELRPDGRLSAEQACQTLRDRGFLVGCYPAGNMLRFSPALTIEESDIVRLIETLDDILGGCSTSR